jgi:hypothetical protein
MNISITAGEPRKVAPAINDNLAGLKAATPVEGYAVRQLARRSGISLAHAMVAAELAGIVKGARHG